MSEDKLAPMEMDAWSGFLRTHAMLYRELERRLVRGHRMQMSTYEFLLRLTWAGEAGVRMSELAQHLSMTSGGLTRLADRLENEGLITRARSEQDLRGYEARITPTGRRRLRQANQQHLQDVRELFLAHFTPGDLETLAGIWRRLREANDDLPY